MHRWTEQEMRAIYDWWHSKYVLGNYKCKAAELGISSTSLTTLIYRARMKFEFAGRPRTERPRQVGHGG